MSGRNKNKTILLVEDDTIPAMAEAMLLTNNGFNVITAVGAREAIDAVKNNDIDLVLMDIDLGEGKMDGTDAAVEIRKEKELPIVFLSSHSEKEYVERVRKITGYGYVVKNSGEPVLLEAVNTAFTLFEMYQKEQESRKRFETIFNQASVGMAQVNPNGTFIDVNNTFCEIVGYTKDELLQLSISDISHPDDLKSQKGYIQEVLSGKSDSYSMEKRYKNKGGSTIWAHIDSSVIRNADNTIRYTIAVVVDITVQKQSVDKLMESEKTYRSLFENMQEGFAYCRMIFDEENRPVDFIYLDVNEAFEGLTGLPRDKVLNKKVTDVIPRIKEGDPDIFELYGRVSRTGIPETSELYLKSLETWFKIAVYSPKKGYFVAVFDNTTEGKKAAEQIREQKEKLERKNTALNELIEQIVYEKNRFADGINEKISSLITPIISEMEAAGIDASYIQRLKYSIGSLSPSGGQYPVNISVLSHRELEICNLIKEGFKNKEIASMLNISNTTVAKHRMRIRKKLQIVNTETNLETFLTTFQDTST